MLLVQFPIKLKELAVLKCVIGQCWTIIILLSYPVCLVVQFRKHMTSDTLL